MTTLVIRTPVPVPRWGAGDLVAFGNRMYLIGGVVSGGYLNGSPEETTYTDRVDVYNPVTNSWSLAAPLPRPNGDHYTWTDGTYIYCGFGEFYSVEYDGNDSNYFVYRYDPSADEWTTLPTEFAVAGLSSTFFAGAGIGTKFYAIRSFRLSSKNYYERVICDVAAGTYSDINVQYANNASSALVPLGDSAKAQVVGSKIYFLNGFDNAGSNNLAVYDPAATPNVALTKIAFPASLDLGSSSFDETLSSFVLDDEGFLWVLSGLVGNNAFRQYKFEVATGQWTQLDDLGESWGAAAAEYDAPRKQILNVGGRETTDPSDPAVSGRNRAVVIGDYTPPAEVYGEADLIAKAIVDADASVNGQKARLPYVGIPAR